MQPSRDWSPQYGGSTKPKGNERRRSNNKKNGGMIKDDRPRLGRIRGGGLTKPMNEAARARQVTGAMIAGEKK